MEASFTHYAVSNHYFLRAVVQVGYVKNRLILHTPGPEIPDLAYHIHSLLTLLTQLLTLLRHMTLQRFQPKWHMILQWFQPKWLSMALCIHGKTILLILLRLLTCHHINVSKMSNLSRGQNSCMNMPTQTDIKYWHNMGVYIKFLYRIIYRPI